MDTRLDQTIPLFPLRLEIRWVHGAACLARHDYGTASGDSEPIRSNLTVASEADLGNQVWLRWYPDDLAMLTSPQDITQEDVQAFDDLIKVYQIQASVSAQLTNLANCYHSLVEAIGEGAGEIERAEQKLYVANGLWPGELTPDESEACERYNRDSLQAILDNYSSSNGSPSEPAKVGVRRGWWLYDLQNPVLAEAWRVFVDEVGLVRARYIVSVLMASEIPGVQSESSEEARRRATTQPGKHGLLKELFDSGIQVGLIPPEIRLYTVKENEVHPLGDPIQVPNHTQLLVATTAKQRARWLEDFDIAVEEGMGIRIQDAGQIEQIRQADWLLVLGVDEKGDGQRRFMAILEGLKSLGRLGLIEQDMPTNNTEGESTNVPAVQSDLDDYLRRTRMQVPRGIQPDGATEVVPSELDAKRLADALRIDPWVFSNTPGAELTEQREAQAMNALVWLLCTDIIKKQWSDVLGLEEEDPVWKELASFFHNFVHASGPLPAFRVGAKPYGVVPVMISEQWKRNPSSRGCFGDLQEKVSRITEFLRPEFRYLADQVPALSRAGEGQEYNTLLEVLRRTAVSRRVELRPCYDWFHFPEDPRFLMLSLVDDKPMADSDSSGSLDYLTSIADWKPGDLPESLQIIAPTGYSTPELNNHTRNPISLLHWLITRFLYADDGAINLDRLQQVSETIKHLSHLSVEKLETVFMEALDSLSHRIDAWSTALAFIRMQECHAESSPIWPYGVYGWLERPGTMTNGALSCRFVQTPSLGQAATAALLANATLNSGNADPQSPLRFGLDSARTRTGLWFLAGLRKGHDEGELLGYSLERMISEEAKAGGPLTHSDIYLLRDLYRLSYQRLGESGASEPRTRVPTVVDGAAFLDDPGRAQKYEDVARRLGNIRDAATDIAVAEMLSSFMQKNLHAAAAWLDFLDGDALPPEPKFCTIQRTGSTCDTRLALNVPVPPPESPAYIDVLKVVDPVLCGLCKELMPEWTKEKLKVRVKRSHSEAIETQLELELEGDLGLHPADLIAIDEDTLLTRVRDVLLSRWKAKGPGFTAELLDALGDFPRPQDEDELRAAIQVKLICWDGSEGEAFSSGPEGYVRMAITLRRMLQRNRSGDSPATFEPTGTGALASMRQVEGQSVNWEKTEEILRARAAVLIKWIDELTGDGSEIAAMLDKQQAVTALDGNCREGLTACLARFRLSKSLLVLPNHRNDTEEAKQELIEMATSRLKRFADELTKRKVEAGKLLGKADSASQHEKRIELVLQALRILSGYPGLPILAPYVARADGGWKGAFGDHIEAEQANLPTYSKVRPAVADLIEVFDNVSVFQLYLNKFEGGQELVLSKSDNIDKQKHVALIALDRFTEFIPSDNETTALAVQYDAPAARAPNAVLIAVPPSYDRDSTWSEHLLAETLRSTLDWMQIRMVTAQDVIGDNVLGHYFPLLLFTGTKLMGLPTANRPLQELMFDRTYDYKLADNMDEDEQQPPDLIAERRSRVSRIQI